MPKLERNFNGGEPLQLLLERRGERREREDAPSLLWLHEGDAGGSALVIVADSYLNYIFFFLIKGMLFAFAVFFNEPRRVFFFFPYIVIDLFCNAILSNIHRLI